MSRTYGILVGLISAAVFGGLAAWAVSRNGASTPMSFKYVLIGLAALAVLVVIGFRKRWIGGEGDRDSGRKEIAASLGFSYESKGSAAFRRSFSDVPGIPDSGKARHVLRGEVAGRPAVMFEHMYMTYNGSTMMPVHHTLVSTDAPDWPLLHIAPRSWVARLARRCGFQRGLELENAEFNTLFAVRCADEDFALTLLTPEMQQYLTDKTNVSWFLRPGRVSLVYSGALRMDRAGRSLERLEKFWSLVPEDLEHWVTSSHAAEAGDP